MGAGAADAAEALTLSQFALSPVGLVAGGGGRVELKCRGRAGVEASSRFHPHSPPTPRARRMAPDRPRRRLPVLAAHLAAREHTNTPLGEQRQGFGRLAGAIGWSNT